MGVLQKVVGGERAVVVGMAEEAVEHLAVGEEGRHVEEGEDIFIIN